MPTRSLCSMRRSVVGTLARLPQQMLAQADRVVSARTSVFTVCCRAWFVWRHRPLLAVTGSGLNQASSCTQHQDISQMPGVSGYLKAPFRADIHPPVSEPHWPKVHHVAASAPLCRAAPFPRLRRRLRRRCIGATAGLISSISVFFLFFLFMPKLFIKQSVR